MQTFEEQYASINDYYMIETEEISIYKTQTEGEKLCL